MLEPPPTLRLARPEEVPKRPELLARIEESKQANIVEGYTLKVNDSHELPFQFYAEINVDNSRLWQVFSALTALLPDPLSCLYGWHEGEPSYSDYLPKARILSQLTAFELELTQDCNLEFGLIHQTEELLVELFIDSSKYLKFWGAEEADFRNLLQ